MHVLSQARLWRGVRFGGFCGYAGWTAYVFIKVSKIIGLLMLPLAARWGSHYLVNTAVDDVPRWLRGWRYRGWHGHYVEFDGRQLRVDDFERDLSRMPLISAQDLENLFRDRVRFRIRAALAPTSGLLAGIPAIPADRAVAWARVIARTRNAEAGRALSLARFIEVSYLEPREKEKQRARAQGMLDNALVDRSGKE